MNVSFGEGSTANVVFLVFVVCVFPTHILDVIWTFYPGLISDDDLYVKVTFIFLVFNRLVTWLILFVLKYPRWADGPPGTTNGSKVENPGSLCFAFWFQSNQDGLIGTRALRTTPKLWPEILMAEQRYRCQCHADYMNNGTICWCWTLIA